VKENISEILRPVNEEVFEILRPGNEEVFEILRPVNEEVFEILRPVKEDISEILPKEIGVKEMNTDNSTIAKIKILCPEVKAVHFFLKRFSSLRLIQRLA
jgi:alpha/beta superfamily hydrolase